MHAPVFNIVIHPCDIFFPGRFYPISTPPPHPCHQTPRPGPPCPLHDLIPSGLNMGSDCPFPYRKEARIGLRFKTSPNQPYFGNRAKYDVLIEADSGPFPDQNGHLTIPGKKGRKKRVYGLLMGIIWGSIWAYFCEWGAIFAFFVSCGIGRFYGRIFGVFPGRRHLRSPMTPSSVSPLTRHNPADPTPGVRVIPGSGGSRGNGSA